MRSHAKRRHIYTCVCADVGYKRAHHAREQGHCIDVVTLSYNECTGCFIKKREKFLIFSNRIGMVRDRLNLFKKTICFGIRKLQKSINDSARE